MPKHFSHFTDTLTQAVKIDYMERTPRTNEISV